MTNTGQARLSVRRWYDISPDVVFESFIEAQYWRTHDAPIPIATAAWVAYAPGWPS